MNRSFSRAALRASGIALVLAPLASIAVASPAIAEGQSSCTEQLGNGGFETPVMSTLVEADIFYDPTNNLRPGGWFVWPGNGNGGWAVVASLPTTDTPMSQSVQWQATEGGVEIQDLSAYAGDQYGEITSLEVSNTLYQSIQTYPGQVMAWSLAHRSAGGTDVMEVQIGADLGSLISQNATPDTGVGVDGQPTYISDGETWRVWRGIYVVPEGQYDTVFGFNGISNGTSASTVGNHIDAIEFACDPLANVPTATPADPSLASTGLTLAAIGAGIAMAMGMFVMAFSSFGARGRLHDLAIDTRLANTLKVLDARLRRLESRNRRR